MGRAVLVLVLGGLDGLARYHMRRRDGCLELLPSDSGNSLGSLRAAPWLVSETRIWHGVSTLLSAGSWMPEGWRSLPGYLRGTIIRMLFIFVLAPYWPIEYIVGMFHDNGDVRESLHIGLRLLLAHGVPVGALSLLLVLFNASIGVAPYTGLVEFWQEGFAQCLPFSAGVAGLWLCLVALSLGNVTLRPGVISSHLFLISLVRTYRWVRRSLLLVFVVMEALHAWLDETVSHLKGSSFLLADGWKAGMHPQME